MVFAANINQKQQNNHFVYEFEDSVLMSKQLLEETVLVMKDHPPVIYRSCLYYLNKTYQMTVCPK